MRNLQTNEESLKKLLYVSRTWIKLKIILFTFLCILYRKSSAKCILRFSRLLSVEKAHLFFPTFSDLFRLFPTFSDFFRPFPTFFQTFSDLFPEKIGWNGKESGKNPEKIQKKFGKSLEKIRKKFGKNPTKFVLKIREDFKQKLQYWVANRKILCKNSSTHFLTGIIIHLTSTENQPQYKID